MIERDLLFLIYPNRSGSTFLANQLSRHPRIAVAPEGHDPLRRLLGQIDGGLSLKERISRTVDDLSADPKLRSWRVEPETFLARASRAEDDIGAFFALCDSFADQHEPDATTVVVKGEFLRSLIASRGYAGLSQGRRVRALFLLRDPRATFASQRRSVSSTSGRAMQDNPLVAGLRWRQAEAKAHALATGDEGRIVLYDDLVLHNERVMQDLARSMEVDAAPFLDASLGNDALKALIPDEQLHLHADIDKPPMAEKIDAWRSSLASREVALLDRLAGNGMVRTGFTPASEARLRLRDIPWLARTTLDAAGRVLRPSRIAGLALGKRLR